MKIPMSEELLLSRRETRSY